MNSTIDYVSYSSIRFVSFLTYYHLKKTDFSYDESKANFRYKYSSKRQYYSFQALLCSLIKLSCIRKKSIINWLACLNKIYWLIIYFCVALILVFIMVTNIKSASKSPRNGELLCFFAVEMYNLYIFLI